MPTVKVFMTGRSQAFNLHKEFRFEAVEVKIFRCANEFIL